MKKTREGWIRGPARPLRKYRNLYRKNFGKIQDFTGNNLEKKRKNKGIIKQVPFHNDFSPSDEHSEQRKSAHTF